MRSSLTTTAFSACPDKRWPPRSPPRSPGSRRRPWRAAYQAGELSLDRNDLRGLLEQLGVTYVEAIGDGGL